MRFRAWVAWHGMVGRCHSSIQRLRFTYSPVAAHWIAWLATFRARAKLSRACPLSLLVDSTVLFHSITHETAWVSTDPAQRGREQGGTGYFARVPVRPESDESEMHREVKYLATIAYLARTGYLSLKTSAELLAEQHRQRAGRYMGNGVYDFNLLSGIRISSLDGFPMRARRRRGGQDSAEQQRARISSSTDQLYLALVKVLGPKNSQDAWHIRTAEVHGQYCLLTMDGPLLKNFKGRRGQEPIRSLQTKLLSPSDLGKELGVVPLPPRLFSYDGASFPVRPDLPLAAGRRRPRKPK